MANPSSVNYRIQNHDHLYPSVAIIELEEIAVLTVTLLEIWNRIIINDHIDIWNRKSYLLN